MKTRKYIQVERAERAARTQARIRNAAQEVLREKGPGGLTLTEVARRAGVSRVALYAHFPGQEALLASLVSVDESALVPWKEACAHPDPAQAVQEVLAVSVRHWSGAGATQGKLAEAAEASTRGLVEPLEAARLELLTGLAQRLAGARLLRKEVRPEQAARLLAVVTGSGVHGQLRASGQEGPVLEESLRLLAEGLLRR